MARPGRPERNRTARSFRQLRRFHHVINSDKVFGTHSPEHFEMESRDPDRMRTKTHCLRGHPLSGDLCSHPVLLANHNPTRAPTPLNATPHSDSSSAPHNSGMKPAIVDATKIAVHVRTSKPEISLSWPMDRRVVHSSLYHLIAQPLGILPNRGAGRNSVSVRPIRLNLFPNVFVVVSQTLVRHIFNTHNSIPTF
jgi:hypothetical protein